MDCIRVKSAEYVADFRILVTFTNGESGEADLRAMIFKYRTAEPIRTVDEFQKFYLDSWPTLAWVCGFDISPEYLYELATGRSTYQNQSA